MTAKHSPASATTEPADPTDRPIPLWPEGVLAGAAAVVLFVVALNHRSWLRRKAGEARRAIDALQEHAAADDLKALAREAGSFLKGKS